uniref:leucine-rich alpha-2-glycoprotein-like n=1 Tax=Myxine glutinosa TaxID=7769 RepID=UPI00358E364C
MATPLKYVRFSQIHFTFILLSLITRSKLSSQDHLCPQQCQCLHSEDPLGISLICNSPPTTPFPLNTVMLSMENSNTSRLPNNWLHGLRNLTELHLSANYLYLLSANMLDTNTPLRVLDLSSNLLSSLPPKLFSLTPELKHLVLRSNLFDSLPSTVLSFLTHLEWIDLTDNQLQEVPQLSLDTLDSLLWLDLSSNIINNVHSLAFRNLKNLERLHLDKNKLHSLPSSLFSGTAALQYLYLSHNHLVTLPPQLLAPLHKLQMLDISHNKFAFLSSQFLHKIPTSLGSEWGQGLSLKGNPWQCGKCTEIAPLLAWLNLHSDKVFSLNDVRCGGTLGGDALVNFKDCDRDK